MIAAATLILVAVALSAATGEWWYDVLMAVLLLAFVVREGRANRRERLREEAERRYRIRETLWLAGDRRRWPR